MVARPRFRWHQRQAERRGEGEVGGEPLGRRARRQFGFVVGGRAVFVGCVEVAASADDDPRREADREARVGGRTGDLDRGQRVADRFAGGLPAFGHFPVHQRDAAGDREAGADRGGGDRRGRQRTPRSSSATIRRMKIAPGTGSGSRSGSVRGCGSRPATTQKASASARAIAEPARESGARARSFATPSDRRSRPAPASPQIRCGWSGSLPSPVARPKSEANAGRGGVEDVARQRARRCEALSVGSRHRVPSRATRAP